MFYAKHKDSPSYVKKQSNGEPCWYSTCSQSDAAIFETEAEALEWANGQFRGKGIAVAVEVNKAKQVKVDGEWIGEDDEWFVQHQL